MRHHVRGPDGTCTALADAAVKAAPPHPHRLEHGVSNARVCTPLAIVFENDFYNIHEYVTGVLNQSVTEGTLTDAIQGFAAQLDDATPSVGVGTTVVEQPTVVHAQGATPERCATPFIVVLISLLRHV